MIVGVTGHRDVEQEPGELLEFARLFVALSGADKMISGMAWGWDLTVAQACVDLGVPFIAACPFPQQASRWPEDVRAQWWRLMGAAESVNMTLSHYDQVAFTRRNKWIVNHSDEIGALDNPGKDRSGTRHCVLYAHKKRVIVRPLWDRWLRFRSERRTRA